MTLSYAIFQAVIAVIIIAAIAITFAGVVTGANSLVELFAAIPQLTLEKLI